MREVTIKKRTVYETDLVLPEGSTEYGMAIWCGVHLEKKLELDFERGVAQFININDALAFENEWNG